MRNLDYIVTGFPRSGTGYTAKVLSKLGFNCGHEILFSHNRSIVSLNEDSIFGDSSWLAAPHLPSLPETTLRLIQLRDPYKVLDSAFPGKGSLVGSARRKGSYARFTARWCRDVLTGESEEERICQWYMHWWSYLNIGQIYMYKVENMSTELSWIRHLIDGEPQHQEGIEEALSIPTDTNHRGETRRWSRDYIENANNETVKRIQDLIGVLGYE